MTTAARVAAERMARAPRGAELRWQSPDAAEALPAFIDNLRRYARGEPLTGVVDRAEGY